MIKDLMYIPDGKNDFGGMNSISNLSNMVGLRGVLLHELTQIGLPVSPATIIPSLVLKNVRDSQKLRDYLEESVAFFEQKTGKKFNDAQNPFFCKIVFSSDMLVSSLPSTHNIGLTTISSQAYIQRVGRKFALGEWAHLLQMLQKMSAGQTDLPSYYPDAGTQDVESLQASIDAILQQNPELDDPFVQMSLVVRALYDDFYQHDYNQGVEASILMQVMVYGNWDENSMVGRFLTRNPNTGEKKIMGSFAKQHFSVDKSNVGVLPIEQIDPVYLEQIKLFANAIEDKFLAIRSVNFSVECGKLWIVDQKDAAASTQAQLRLLLDKRATGAIDDAVLFNTFQPRQLMEMLHPQLNQREALATPPYSGGLSGSPGAACGRVYFSTASFLDAYGVIKATGEKPQLILAMEATYAEEVQAIELSQGVISSEGGFSSHAPVVARSLGKPAIVLPGLIFHQGTMTLPDGKKVEEGDWVSFDSNYDKLPRVYCSQIELAYPDVEKNGLTELIGFVQKYVQNFSVRCNADQAKDVRVGLLLGSQGVGLCRTEHMFFQADRIMKVRQMLLAQNVEERVAVLEQIKQFQKSDFLDILLALNGKPLTVRLLDAPLHEFLPKKAEDFDLAYQWLQKEANFHLSKEEMSRRFAALKEVNPMLGHRGCRVAISYPEIYQYQILALFEAAMEAVRSVAVDLEIMIPMVMSDRELDMIFNGKQIEGEQMLGLIDIEQRIVQNNHLERLPFSCKWGTMIELPGAALAAAKLAKHASFFSFGTNDMTQTTLGLSRDDINNFYSNYSKFDLFEFNPFQKLCDPVKELVLTAVMNGRMIRPDLKTGICGEHGAEPETVVFAIENGLDYVSCSPYSAPIALFAAAKYFSEQK